MQKESRDSIKTTIHKRDVMRPQSDEQKSIVLQLNQQKGMVLQDFNAMNRPSVKHMDVQRQSLPNGKQSMIVLNVNQNLGYNSYR
jgi:hypothetical protein